MTKTPNLDLHPMEASALQARRERVFLVLAGLFLGTLAMLNILGISRFLVLFSLNPSETGWGWNWGQWGDYSFALAIGVLPYPLTFLCTDLMQSRNEIMAWQNMKWRNVAVELFPFPTTGDYS